MDWPDLGGWLSSEYGNIASVLGLLISLATLVVAASTRRQIDETKRRIIANLSKTEALVSTSLIEVHLAELNAFCEALDWPFASDRCQSIIKLLTVLRQSEALPMAQQTGIRSAIDDLKTIRQALEVKRQRKDSHRLDASKRAKLADVALLIAEVKHHLNAIMREV